MPREHTSLSTTRRDVIRSIGAGALGAAFAAGASPAPAQMAQGHREVRPGTPPLQGVRAIEIIDDIFPDKSTGKPMVEQMIEKGKQWWLLDKLMPATADSLKTGYTQKQLKWCKENEGLIWNYFVTNENLEAIEPDMIQNYIGESPTTQGMPQSSPGNIGQWVGWQIVKKFAAENSSLNPTEIMNTPARKILTEAKYKPK